jgi:protein SCO1/2
LKFLPSGRALWLSAALLMLMPALASRTSAAQSYLPPPPKADFVQHLGAQLPLQAAFVDDNGRAGRLGDFFGTAPVLLVPGYYHCPNLCSTVMEGVLETLAAIALPAKNYRLVAISIDPGETAATAASRKIAYRTMLGGDGVDLHLLTGKADAIARVMQTIGYKYQPGPGAQYAHAAGFVVATPDGHISRYFMGVRFNRRDTMDALRTAADGGTGGLADRLLLLCAHYDPATGRYSVTVMTAVRTVCLAVLALLGAWMWRHRRARKARR